MVHTILTPKPAWEPSADPEAFEAERERLHRQMLSSVSHDLKTPLASMIGALEILERMKDRLPEDKKSALVAVALQEFYRLDSFITNILDMAKLENGMVTARREKAEFGSMIRDSIQRIDNRNVGSKIDIKAPAPVEVMTDPVLMGRAVGLLLDNAIKYGGKPPVIQVEFGITPDNFGFIAINDNGNGVSDDKLESIFSKYTRSVKEDQQTAGTGLGLAICRSIMKLLGGKVSATNQVGRGTVFTLFLPLG